MTCVMGAVMLPARIFTLYLQHEHSKFHFVWGEGGVVCVLWGFFVRLWWSFCLIVWFFVFLLVQS